MSRPDVCVVHLVRARNGLAPLKNFLASYERYGAGLDHELLFILKGFTSEKIDEELERQLARFKHHRLFVADWGYDITAYFKAGRRFDYSYFMFTNSYSEILADDWLLKLYRALLPEHVGLAGTTGSYNGYHADERSMSRRRRESVANRGALKKAILQLPGVEFLNECKRLFLYPRFPNPHLRSNGFIVRRATMMRLHPQITPTKFQAYRFEYGSRSMTNQILRMGKEVVVVGKNGKCYDIVEWRGSQTFWEAAQGNLLVSDNQTRRYQAANEDTRKVFTWYAWGSDGLRHQTTDEIAQSANVFP